ncbi:MULTISPECIES: Lmo0850 family protein [Bacillales]|nr:MULTISPECIES: Lmo0850 family protein [Bacillaceae]MED1490640.1 Lmo0850 family protein [Bacillus smithii]
MNNEMRVLQIINRLRAMGIPAEITKSRKAIFENLWEKERREILADGKH